MRAVIAALLLLSTSMPVAAQGKEIPAHVRAQGWVQIAFAPWDDAEAMIVGALSAARRQILVQAYGFTSRAIANALIDAHRRGVNVRITADRDQTLTGESGRIPDLVAAGIPVLLEVRYASAHNKVMVIDAGLPQQAVITGSYNWTWSAQNRNAENVLILRRNAEAARAYAANWWRHAADALPYETALAEAPLPADARQRWREPVKAQ
jgi:phosphatidylserine/phosphatidylglycerophosphate/cardiolipin synthase-like enzyme